MDGEIVCHHDVTLERMFGDPRHVDTVNTRELGGLRFGRRRRRATPLDGFSSALPDDVVPMLELKDWRFAEPARVHRLVDRLGARVADRRVGVITEHLSLLRAGQAAAPLNPVYVRIAHRRRQRVCPLDPGLHRRLARYLALDVDALLTNDPRGTRARVEGLRGEPLR